MSCGRGSGGATAGWLLAPSCRGALRCGATLTIDALAVVPLGAPLPRQPTSVDVQPDLAAVFFDGGRMRTREPDQGRGVHQPHWRETKNAGFHRMKSQSFSEDPQPELPDCFRNEAYVEKLVKGLKNLKKEGREEELEVGAAFADQHGVGGGVARKIEPPGSRRLCSTRVSVRWPAAKSLGR